MYSAKIIWAAGFLLLGFVLGYLTPEYHFVSREENVEEDTIDEETQILLENKSGKIELISNGVIGPSILRASDSSGRIAQVETYPVGANLFPDKMGFGYIIVTRSEKGVFENVRRILFGGEGPIIESVIPAPGLFEQTTFGQWFHIPPQDLDSDNNKIILETLDTYGRNIDSWQLGLELAKDSQWNKTYWPESTELLNTDELILTFSGQCGTEGLFPTCARYLLNVKERSVYPLSKL